MRCLQSRAQPPAGRPPFLGSPLLIQHIVSYHPYPQTACSIRTLTVLHAVVTGNICLCKCHVPIRARRHASNITTCRTRNSLCVARRKRRSSSHCRQLSQPPTKLPPAANGTTFLVPSLMCVSNCIVSSILETEMSSGKPHTGRLAALLMTSQQTLHCRWFGSPHPSGIIRHVSAEDSAPSSSFTNLPPSHLNFSLW